VSGGPAPTPASPGGLGLPTTAPLAPPAGRVVTVVAVVVVVALVLLAALLLLRSSSNGGSGAGVDFRSAESSANSTADSSGFGNPLEPLLGLAIHGNSSLTTTITGPSTSGTCALGLLAGSSLAIPASSGSAGSGTGNFWEFLYEHNATSFLAVVVSGGQAQAVFVMTGAACVQSLGNGRPLPAGVIDSTTAAADANAAGGSAFLGAHPQAAGFYEVLPQVRGVGAEWAVGYTTCPESSQATGNSTEFLALLNATSGTVLQNHTETITCAPLSVFGASARPPGPIPPVGTAFGFGSPMSTVGSSSTAAYCASGDQCFVVPVAAAAPGLTGSDLAFGVESSSGSPLQYAGSRLSLVSVTGSVVGSFDLATGTWTSGQGSPITNTDSLALDLGCPPSTCSPPPAGDLLVAFGISAYTGTAAVTLP
jgi:hypothetical protein